MNLYCLVFVSKSNADEKVFFYPGVCCKILNKVDADAEKMALQ